MIGEGVYLAIKELMEQGASNHQIARALRIPKSTVLRNRRKIEEGKDAPGPAPTGSRLDLFQEQIAAWSRAGYSSEKIRQELERLGLSVSPSLVRKYMARLRAADPQLRHEHDVALNSRRVQFLRRKKGWTPDQLAKRAGVSKKTIERIEAGKSVRLPFCSKVAEALEVKLDTVRGIWNVPPSLGDPYFTGRKGLLQEMQHVFASGEGAPPILVLYGPEGSGKTRLAAEYADRNADDYRVVWWVRSERTAKKLTRKPVVLADDYADLARKLTLPEKDNQNQQIIIRPVREWLKQNGGWLLIFDDVSTLCDVIDYIPDRNSGNVLITSRDSDGNLWADSTCYVDTHTDENAEKHFRIQFLHVGRLEREESVAFLCKKTGQNDHAAMCDLAEEFGDFPQALEVAAAYIQQKRMSPTEFLASFPSFRKKQLEHLLRPVVNILRLSISQVSKTSPEAAKLLTLCAFLAPNADIPRTLFENTVTDSSVLDKAIEVLWHYSLVKENAGILSVHHSMQDVVRNGLSKDEQQRWSKNVLSLIQTALPFRSDDERITRPESLCILMHALEALEHAERFGEVDIREKFGIKLFQAIRYDIEGKHDDAVSICEEILDKIGTGDEAFFSTACVELAAFYDHQSQLTKALEILECLILQLNNRKHYDEKYWWALYQKGIMLRRLGQQLNLSKEVFNKVYEEFSKSEYTGKYDYHISALHQLGVIDFEQGLYDDAEKKFIICLDNRRKDKNNHRLAYEYRRLGQIYTRKKCFGKALNNLEEAKKIAEACKFHRYAQEVEKDIKIVLGILYSNPPIRHHRS